MPAVHCETRRRPFRSSCASLEQQVAELATIIRASKHLVVYTGAGISTSAGIPDYRGPEGVWTLKSQGKRPPPIAYEEVQPTLAHRALALLVKTGLVKHVVTQNVDGLHAESGVPEEQLSELHGNARKERCEKCGTEYSRQFSTWNLIGCTVAFACTKRNLTSLPESERRCEDPGCSGPLRHCVTMFGGPLPVQSAERETAQADAALVLGSSLRIRPACDFPLQVAARKGKLVIVNLSPTPLDSKADLVIRATCDQVMTLLLRELGLNSTCLVGSKIERMICDRKEDRVDGGHRKGTRRRLIA